MIVPASGTKATWLYEIDQVIEEALLQKRKNLSQTRNNSKWAHYLSKAIFICVAMPRR